MIKPRSRRGGGRPTISDVARKAGVGAITVSRALREPERVSEELRRQIQAAIDELGYVPDPNARALASARAEVFGVLVPSLTNNVFAEVVRGIYDSLSDSPFRIQLGNTHYSGLEEERLLQVFGSQRPAALIVAGIDQTPTSRKLLENAGCPVVQVMASGEPLTDQLREGWLDAIGERIAASVGKGQGVVAACSALKRSYRERLRRFCPEIVFLYLEIDPATARQRVASRKGHFMARALHKSTP